MYRPLSRFSFTIKQTFLSETDFFSFFKNTVLEFVLISIFAKVPRIASYRFMNSTKKIKNWSFFLSCFYLITVVVIVS